MAAYRSINKDMFSGEVLSVDRVCSFISVGRRSVFISLHKCECAARKYLMVAYLTYCCTGRSLPLGIAFSRPPLYSIGA